MNSLQSKMLPQGLVYINHITDINPWTNIPATLHIHVPLHFYCRLYIQTYITAHIHQKSINCIIYYIIANYVPPPTMLLKCHKYSICPNYKLLNVHLWGKYINRYAIYEVATIYVARIALHWQRRNSPITYTELAIGKISQKISIF